MLNSIISLKYFHRPPFNYALKMLKTVFQFNFFKKSYYSFSMNKSPDGSQMTKLWGTELQTTRSTLLISLHPWWDVCDSVPEIVWNSLSHFSVKHTIGGHKPNSIVTMSRPNVLILSTNLVSNKHQQSYSLWILTLQHFTN